MDKVRELRKKLHDIPELSGNEIRTAETIKNFLRYNTNLKIVDMGKYFYAVHYEGNKYKNIAFRADMDAISGENGAYHGCGHDGHSAALAGLALKTNNMKLGKNIFFLFQPAEEIGKGAEICLKMLDNEKIDEIYGWHNIPRYKEGLVLLRQGSFACASKGITMKFTGKQCHAAYPETGTNPSFVIAKLVDKLNEFTDNNLYSASVLATIVNINVGSVNFGISAGYGELSMTVRAKFLCDLDKLQNRIFEFADTESKKHGIELSYDVFDEFPDTVNDDCLFLNVKTMLEEEKIDYKLLSEPMRWSEDFGHYAKKIKGFFFGIGAGENYPALHTQKYKFNDAILDKAISVMFKILQAKDKEVHLR